MEFIRNNVDILNIIQILINKGCILYGSSVRDFLINHTLEKINVYIPSEEVINAVNSFKNYFEYSIELKKEQFKFEVTIINKNKTMWKINNIQFHFTIAQPKPKKEINKLYIDKHGISIFDYSIYNTAFRSIKVLELLRKINEKIEFKSINKENDENFKSIDLMLEWIRYFLIPGNSIYGGWPSRYITSDKPEDMNRDIDIITNDIQSIENLMIVLKKTGLCKTNDNRKYNLSSLNVEMNCEIPLKFDIHKKSNDITCDAFYNNLKMTHEYITINYQPENINYISTILLIFDDLFHNKYTLICPIPKSFENKSDFRLITKPIIFSSERTIDYAYLEFSDEKFVKVDDILSNDECCRHYHKINKELDFLPIVVLLGRHNICLHCMHKHVFNI